MRASAFLLIGLAVSATAQTRVDLQSQSKNIDFSQATSVRPFRTGTALPSLCVPGEMFFKTDAAPGSNVFGCVAENTWSVQSESELVDFEADLDTTSNRLTVACNRGSCNVQEGDVIRSLKGTLATFVPSTGTYTAFVYMEGPTLRYGYTGGNMSLCTATCVPGITEFPNYAIPLFTVDVINGLLKAGSMTDRRTRYRAPKRALPGPNMVITETAGTVTYSSLPPATVRIQPPGAQPVCSASTRGTIWYLNGGAGVKDNVTVCAKDAADGYAWRAIY